MAKTAGAALSTAELHGELVKFIEKNHDAAHLGNVVNAAREVVRRIEHEFLHQTERLT